MVWLHNLTYCTLFVLNNLCEYFPNYTVSRGRLLEKKIIGKSNILLKGKEMENPTKG